MTDARQAAPTQPEALTVEPFTGWRWWRLTLDGCGVALGSTIHRTAWPAGRALRAACGRHDAPVPAESCSCGVYALADPDDLPHVVFAGSAELAPGAVGTVALWGRVVVHRSGYRAEFAYPQRLRLVCGPCALRGRFRDPIVAYRSASGLAPVCPEHEEPSRTDGRPAEVVRSELLARYAVDLLPVEMLPVAPEGRSEEDRRAPSPLARFGWHVLRVSAVILAFWLLFGNPIERPERGPASGSVRSAPVTSAPASRSGSTIGTSFERPRAGRIQERERRRPLRRRLRLAWRLAFATVCGRPVGDAVRLVGCRRPDALLGFVTAPPGPRSSCEGGLGYSRRRRFSVCWLGLPPPDGPPRRWRLPGVHPADLTR